MIIEVPATSLNVSEDHIRQYSRMSRQRRDKCRQVLARPIIDEESTVYTAPYKVLAFLYLGIPIEVELLRC